MKALILILLVSPPALLCAQEFQFRQEYDTIPVEIDGWRPFTPWAGGISESNPAMVDIDADSDLDIFIGEFIGYISFWQNTGNFQLPNYQFITNQYDSIYMQESRANPCFKDLDGDGDFDLIVGDIDSHVHYYQNIGNSQNPEYVLITNNLVPPQPPWIVGPEFIDIDADGDFDLLGGADQQITFYRNIGTPQQYNFQAVTGNFSNIYITNGWASPEFVDIDSDGDYDLFIGERYGHIWYYRNDGDSVNYNFTFVTNNYNDIDVGDYASPEFADIDGDGDFDLQVGRDNIGYVTNPGDVWYYKNIGTPQEAQWQLVTKNYLSLDTGYLTTHHTTDIDADGDQDLFMMNDGDYVSFYENIGDSASASFRWVTDTYQNIFVHWAGIAFGDIDSDHDADLFIGEVQIPSPPYPGLYLYQNRGTPQNALFSLVSENLLPNNYFVGIKPALADIDADGDQDIFLSDDDGYFFYYENVGTPSQPQFSYQTNQWQGLYNPYPFCSARKMAFGDLDNDGDLDLLIEDIYLQFYRNRGTPQSPNMVLETETFLDFNNDSGVQPTLLDIDSDGDLDLLLATSMAGIYFFRNITGDTTAAPLPKVPYRACAPIVSISPNPVNSSAVFQFDLPMPGPVRLEICDITGRIVNVQNLGLLPAGIQRRSFDTTQLASGVYVFKVEAVQLVMTGKLVVLK